MNQNAIEVDWSIVRNITIEGAVDASGEDMNAVSDRREPSAQGVNRINRPTVAVGWDIGRSDVENSQCLYY